MIHLDYSHQAWPKILYQPQKEYSAKLTVNVARNLSFLHYKLKKFNSIVTLFKILITYSRRLFESLVSRSFLLTKSEQLDYSSSLYKNQGIRSDNGIANCQISFVDFQQLYLIQKLIISISKMRACGQTVCFQVQCQCTDEKPQ